MLSKKLFPFLICTISVTSYAQLPDEINYSPYYTEYEVLALQRDRVAQDLRHSEDSLQYTFDRINQLQDLVQQYYRQIERDQYEIDNLLSQRDSGRNKIQEIAIELQRLERIVDQLKREQKNLQDDISRRQRTLAPFQRELGAKTQQLRQEQQKLENIDSQIAQKKAEVQSLEQRLSQLTQSIESSQKLIQDLKVKKQESEKKLAQLDRQKTLSQKSIDSLEGKFTVAQTKVKDLTKELKTQQDTLKRLELRNAPKEQIIAQRKKVLVAKQNLDSAEKVQDGIQRSLRAERSKLSALTQEERQVQAQLNQIPARIQQAQQKIRDLNSQIQVTKSKVTDTNRELARLQSTRNSILESKRMINREIATIQADVNRIQDQIVSVTQNLRRVDSEIQEKSQRQSDLFEQRIRLSQRLSQISQDMTRLESEIRTTQQRVYQSQNDLVQYQTESEQLQDEIVNFQSQLARIRNQTNIAQEQYERRFDLYNYHLNAARELGSSQSSSAIQFGKEDGLKLAQQISQNIANEYGNEYGVFKGKLTGFIRGEIDGYQNGYNDGVSSQDSINQGKKDGEEAGKVKAYNYANSILKPQFFNDYLTELLQRPLDLTATNSLSANKSLSNKNFVATSESRLPDLTENEINQSLQLNTSLDSIIQNLLDSEIEMAQKLKQYSDASFTYQVPTNIPFENVNCNDVYKGVVDFIQACQDNYRLSFKQKYLSHSFEEYSINYGSLFTSTFERIEEQVSSNSYPLHYTSTYETVFAEAKIKGEQEAYDNSYEEALELGHQFHIRPATVAAKKQAKVEADEWIATNSAITVEKSMLSSSSLRGGDKGFLTIELKNIGNKDAIASGVLDITKSQNLEFEKSSYALIPVKSKSIVTMQIPFKVSESAKSGDKIMLVARAALKGDRYQSARIEQLSLEQTLTVNPKFTMQLAYDETPKIKGFRSFYIHNLSATLSPEFEEIAEGYTIKLSALGDGESNLEFKQRNVATGRLSAGESKKVDLSYVFKSSARGKEIQLKLEVYFQQKLLQEKIISLRPY